VEDLCKPHPLAGGLNLKPTPAFDLQVRAGEVILHLWALPGEQTFWWMQHYEKIKCEPGGYNPYNK
jgi:hypothetical protein